MYECNLITQKVFSAVSNFSFIVNVKDWCSLRMTKNICNTNLVTLNLDQIKIKALYSHSCCDQDQSPPIFQSMRNLICIKLFCHIFI